MAGDLFAGAAVSDYERAVDWYARLLGAQPAFRPNATEAVWQVSEHGYVYVVAQSERVGQALHTIFVDDLAEWLARAVGNGVEPASEERYDNGVRKVTFVDPDGNEISFGGAAADD